MQPHVLFDFLPNDNRDELDDRVQRTYTMLKQMIATTTTPKEAHDVYTNFISVKQTIPPTSTPTITPPIPPLTGSVQPVTNPSVVASSTTPNAQVNPVPTSPVSTNQPTLNNVQHTNLEDLTMGLLVASLAEPELGQTRYYQDVISFSKDNLTLFSTYLNMIIIEKTPRLRDHSIKQILWLSNQLIKSNSNTCETILFSLIRHIIGGDLSPRNLRLTEGVLDLLIENRTWLINSSTFMVQLVIYTFMRLLVDHCQPNYAVLKHKEKDFVIAIIREKFLDCVSIGKDFLRLLYQINKIPEFEKLWHDIIKNPKSLHSTFQGPMQMLSIRTPRKLILSRLTFDMERKLGFCASHIKFGQQKNFQDQFSKQYLSQGSSLSLRSDLIRYMCTNIHPSNEVLCSDVVPRWAIVGWLLGSCTTPISVTHTRLALFLDWLVYDGKADNIMNIEPGILVMFHSVRTYLNLTASLLDFFCHLPTIFIPKLSDQIRVGMKKSLHMILEKRVITSLPMLFDNPKLDQGLRALIRECFPEFSQPAPIIQPQNTTNSTQPNAQLQPPILSSANSNNSTQHQTQTISVATDNGISSSPQQFIQVVPNNPNLAAYTCSPITTNQLNLTPKPPSHLPLGNSKQENFSSNNHVLKTNSPTDGPASFGPLASGQITSTTTGRLNIGNSHAILSQGDTVTPMSVNDTPKDEKPNYNPNPWSGTIDRPTSPEVMIVDQVKITAWSQQPTTFESTDNITNATKQQTVNHKMPLNSITAQQQQQNKLLNSTSEPNKNTNNTPNNNNNNNNGNDNNNSMTKTTGYQSMSKNGESSEFSLNNISAPTQSSTSHSKPQPSETNNSKQQSMNNNMTIVNNNSLQLPGNTSPTRTERTATNNHINTSDTSEISIVKIIDTNSRSTTHAKVLYPFMIIPELNFQELIEIFEPDLRIVLSEFDNNRSDDNARCELVDRLLEITTDKVTQSISLGPASIKNLSHCLAYLFLNDFTSKIFPSSCVYNNQQTTHLIKDLTMSLQKPLFKMAKVAFNASSEFSSTAMTLLANIHKHFEATSFLVLYYLRASHLLQILNSNIIFYGSVGKSFKDFCDAIKRKDTTKFLYDDLKNAATYDQELFCFLLPSVFGDMVTSGSFTITNNIEIIRLVVTNLDPIKLQELVCLCLTGTAKMMNKEGVLPLIEASLNWESWEQFNLWRLISAQAVSIEDYISILPRLNSQNHSEAMSSILLNLQRVHEPTIALLQVLINCETSINDPYITSILRYWSMKTDVQDLARLITSLVDSKPPSPPVKRKGTVKPKTGPASSTPSLTPQTEKVLHHLNMIRLRAPKNKLLAQTELLEMLTQVEGLCNREQKKLFGQLFENRPKPAKKQKKSD